ncbi:MAG: diguanylate cyclase [Rhodocyclaceae bacterium]|nr:diguanylate cyclase [Rhodocyclaceae bacterium]
MPFKRTQFRLSSWIRLGIVTTVLLSTLALLAVIDHFARSYAREQAKAHLQQMAWQMRDSLDHGIRERFVDIRLLSFLPAVTQTRDRAAVRIALEELQSTLPSYAWIGLAMPDGTVFAATGGVLEGRDVSARPWFQNARENMYAGDYHPALLLESKLPRQNEPWRFIDVAAPVVDASGKLRGVLGAHLSWSWTRDLAQRLFESAQRRYQIEVLIVNKDGMVLLGPQGLVETHIDTPSFRAAQQGESGAVAEHCADGDYITGYIQTNQKRGFGLGWSVLVRQPRDVAMVEFNRLEGHMLGVGLMLALVLSVIGAFIARRLWQPLDALSSAVEQRAHGDDTPIPQPRGYREVQVLSRALSEMVARDQRQRAALNELNHSLESQVQERTAALRQAADQLQTALMEQHAIREELQRMALHDALTGLPNRRAFHEELPRAMARTPREGMSMAVLFMDLDGFKDINDSYGHEAGDAVLREFAVRIGRSVRVTDMVARLAGDEFTVILERLHSDADAAEVAGKLLGAMEEPFAFGDVRLTLAVSIGIALFRPTDRMNPDQLLHAADQAMYAAKRSGRNRVEIAAALA